MNLEYDPRTHTAVIKMKSGAVVKIREDEDGDLEIRETTHRMLSVKPMARNTIYVALEDPIARPRLIEYDLPYRQTADLDDAEEAPLSLWEVPMKPRNLPSAAGIHVKVEANSPEEAISKALSAKPGHTWGTPKQIGSTHP